MLSRVRHVARFTHKHAKTAIRAGKAAGHVAKYVSKKMTKSPLRKVKKIEPKIDLGQGHSGQGHSTIKINENPKGLKMLKKHSKGGIFRYQQSYNQVLTSTVGLQSVTDLCAINTIPQAITSTGYGFAWYQNDTALEQLNPYLTNTGSAKLASIVTPLNDRFVINNNSLTLEFTNFEPVSAEVDIYVLKNKKYTAVGPSQHWQTGYSNMAFGLSPAVPASNAVIPVSGYANYNLVGTTPKQSQLFSSFWKVCTVRSLYLAPASTEKLSIEFAIDKVIKCDEFRNQNTTAGILFAPISSYSIMVVQRGGLVLDNTSGTQHATYGPTKVGCVIISKTSCSAVLGDNSARLNTMIINDSTPVGAANSALSLLNEVDATSGPNIV